MPERQTTSLRCFFLSVVLFLQPGESHTSQPIAIQNAVPSVDVLHYNASIEPDIVNKTLKGSVRILFVSRAHGLKSVEFDCGDLEINAVQQDKTPRQYLVQDHRLKIELRNTTRIREELELQIDYHGAPKRGIRFFPDQRQVYTIFSTSQWMVCVDAPDDRATLSLNLILPAELKAVANGQLVSQNDLPNRKVAYEWQQKVRSPTYIFGFAVGPFRVLSEKKKHVEFRYLGTSFSDDELRLIFRDTPDMLSFYEDRSGVRYANRTYTQVLAAGGVEQEMSSFTALNESYGKRVLANEQDLWLGAHELAHQWWGNMVTCRDWNHFWLNEGMATFMAAAYMEHRFGRASYLREIETYRANYEKVRLAGKDKSLVFPDWPLPTREDRTLVYDKGAYVLHLLREEMGETAFWSGLRTYTQRHFGKSVVTTDFQTAMEQAAGKKLTTFFAKWIYLQDV